MTIALAGRLVFRRNVPGKAPLCPRNLILAASCASFPASISDNPGCMSDEATGRVAFGFFELETRAF
jgi:hypothetical protein